MPVADSVAFLFTDGADVKEARKRLYSLEDEIFVTKPGEDSDLATHVQSDLPRFQTLHLGQKVLEAESRQNARRILIGFLVLGAILLTDRHVPWEEWLTHITIKAEAATSSASSSYAR